MLLIYSRRFFLLLLILNPFFIYANNIPSSIIDKVSALQLHNSYIWKNLLHIKDTQPSINHASFLMSLPHFSLKNEFDVSLKAFFKTDNLDDTHAICKYPARFIWMKKELGLNNHDFPKVNCKNFNEYLKKTAVKSIGLVFVSENTASPSSMMGHVFFKLSGIDGENNKPKHAVSFFTVIDTMNIPSLLIKSTITGMKGFFILRPYAEQIKRYLEEENRNIWEYTLNLSEEQQQLIYFHFWELKDVKVQYLFTGFNCATIVHDMLSMTSDKLSKARHLWVTPKDVIKDAKAHGLIQNTSLQSSDQWYIKMLIDELKEVKNTQVLNSNILENIDNVVLSQDKKTMFLEKELLLSYSKYQYHNAQIDKNKWEQVSSVMEHTLSYNVDLSQYKDPLNTVNDTQASISYLVKENKNYIKLGFLPASNTLYDDNREYFSESDLRIMAFEVLINKKKITLDSFDLYSVKSLVPWDSFTGGISSSFNINYISHYDENGEFKAYNLSGGLGYTKQYFNDMFFYSLLHVGVAYGESNLYLYMYPEVGLVMYEVFDMKTVVNYRYFYNQNGSKEGYHDIHLEQSFFLNKDFRIGLGVDYKSILKLNKSSYLFSVNYYF